MAARDWSLAYRHDPEFLTDAFLLAVLRADRGSNVARPGSAWMPHSSKRHFFAIGEPISQRKRPPNLRASRSPCRDPAGEMGAARILDANFNRAREAARVLEDYCRFVLDDRILTEEVKSMRHGLGHAASRLPAPLLLACP